MSFVENKFSRFSGYQNSSKQSALCSSLWVATSSSLPSSGDVHSLNFCVHSGSTWRDKLKPTSGHSIVSMLARPRLSKVELKRKWTEVAGQMNYEMKWFLLPISLFLRCNFWSCCLLSGDGNVLKASQPFVWWRRHKNCYEKNPRRMTKYRRLCLASKPRSSSPTTMKKPKKRHVNKFILKLKPKGQVTKIYLFVRSLREHRELLFL